MDSNKHGTMEQNEEHILMNILIYSTHKTEQYATSYGMMNMGLKHEGEKTYWENDLVKVNGI